MGIKTFFSRVATEDPKEPTVAVKDVELQNGASSSETADLLSVPPSDMEAHGRDAIRRMNRRLLPFTALIVMLSYLDRGNLGFVAADVCTELEMNHTRYGVGVALFGVGYITSQVPSNYFLRRCGATMWFALLMVTWGLVAACFAFVHNRFEFYILRFLLGVAEGGTFPGVWYFLTVFFPDQYLTYPYATVESAISIASPLASPLAAGLLSMEGIFHVEGWRLLFFVEGVMPILYGGILYWLLPSTPEQATFLTREQKTWLRQQHCTEDLPEQHMVREVNEVIRSKQFWIIVLNALIRGALLTAAFYWTTLIIDHMLNEQEIEDDDTCASSKSTNINSVVLTAVPFTISAVFSLWFGHVTANLKNRSRMAGWFMAVSGVCLYGWVIFRHVSFVMALLSLSFSISFFMSPNALIVGLVGSLFDKQTRATAIALFNSLSGVGMIIGPIFIGYIVDNNGYGLAVTILAAGALVGGVALLAVKDPLVYNTKSDSLDSVEEQG